MFMAKHHAYVPCERGRIYGMPTWNYEVTAHGGTEDLEKRLNDLSGQGYVLHSIVGWGESLVLTVRRAREHTGDWQDDPLSWLRHLEDEDQRAGDAKVIALRSTEDST